MMANETYFVMFNGTGENCYDQTWKCNNINGRISKLLERDNAKTVTMPDDTMADINDDVKGIVLNGIGTLHVASKTGTKGWEKNEPILPTVTKLTEAKKNACINDLLLATTGAELETTRQPDLIMSGTGVGRLFNVQRAIVWLYNKLKNQKEERNLTLNITGWSRGATSAIFFMKSVSLLVDYMKNQQGITALSYPSLNVILFDPVYGALENEYVTLKEDANSREAAKYSQLTVETIERDETSYKINGCPIKKMAVILSLHEKRQNFKPYTLSTLLDEKSQYILGEATRPIIEIALPGIHDDQATSVGGMSQNIGRQSHDLAADIVGRFFSIDDGTFKMNNEKVLETYNQLAGQEIWDELGRLSESIGIIAKINKARIGNLFGNLSLNDISRSLSRTGKSKDEERETVFSPRNHNYFSINIIHNVLIVANKNKSPYKELLQSHSDPIINADDYNDTGIRALVKWHSVKKQPECELQENYKTPAWLIDMYTN